MPQHEYDSVPQYLHPHFQYNKQAQNSDQEIVLYNSQPTEWHAEFYKKNKVAQ